MKYLLAAAVLLTASALLSAPANADRYAGSRAYVYFDEKNLTWRIGNEAVERTVRFDRDTGSLHSTDIKSGVGGARITDLGTHAGEITLAVPLPAGGTEPRTLSLGSDWAYVWQSVTTPPHGGRLLTIHMQGLRQHAGFEVEALFEVRPGNRPFLAKSFTLINRTDQPVTVTGARYDRLVVSTTPARVPVRRGRRGQPAPPPPAPPKPASFVAGREGAGAIVDAASGAGVAAAVLGPGGGATFREGMLLPAFAGSLTAAPEGGRAWLPPSVVFAYKGDAAEGFAILEELRGSALAVR
jgi:hypothetical protein